MRYRLRSGRKEIVLDGSEGIYVYGTENGGRDAAGKLMELTLLSHSSVIVYAKKPDFYRYVRYTEPQWLATFTADTLSNDIGYPWIGGLSAAAHKAMKECFENTGCGRDLVFLKGSAKDKPRYARPGMAQCFYQICDRGSIKKRVYAEALFTGILKELVSREPIRDVAVFYEAPMKPFSDTCLETIKEAAEQGICLIGMYEGSGSGYDKGPHGVTSKNGTLCYRTGKKEIKVTG